MTGKGGGLRRGTGCREWVFAACGLQPLEAAPAAQHSIIITMRVSCLAAGFKGWSCMLINASAHICVLLLLLLLLWFTQPPGLTSELLVRVEPGTCAHMRVATAAAAATSAAAAAALYLLPGLASELGTFAHMHAAAAGAATAAAAAFHATPRPHL
jgi:hypothetical protein